MPFSEVHGTPGAARSANAASGSPLTGFWTATPGNPAQYWSPEMFDLLGCGASDLTPSAEAWLTAVHPDDRAAAGRGYLEDRCCMLSERRVEYSKNGNPPV